jgi:F0F1-type ATP synthase epsilon subunit
MREQAKGLRIEVVTPQGVAMEQDGLDEIVMRRLEPEYRFGSEVAVFPRHGPLIVRVGYSPVRCVTGGQEYNVWIGPGFVEVRDNVVSFLVEYIVLPENASAIPGCAEGR